MSGIDEQFRDIPECPICGEEPKYWVLETNLSGGATSMLAVIAWLFRDKYAEGAKDYYQGKHVGVGDKRFGITKITEFAADNITAVEPQLCGCKKYFRGPTFNKVKRVVDYWLKKEGFGSEWDR